MTFFSSHPAYVCLSPSLRSLLCDHRQRRVVRMAAKRFFAPSLLAKAWVSWRLAALSHSTEEAAAALAAAKHAFAESQVEGAAATAALEANQRDRAAAEAEWASLSRNVKERAKLLEEDLTACNIAAMEESASFEVRVTAVMVIVVVLMVVVVVVVVVQSPTGR